MDRASKRSAWPATLIITGALVFMTGVLLRSGPAPAAPVDVAAPLSVAQECQQALGYPARTTADRTWLNQCVHALRTPAPSPSPSGSPSPSPTSSATPGPTATPTPTPAPTTPSPSPTTLPTPSPTLSGPCAGAAGTPGGPDPSGGCWPSSATTGVPAGTLLTASGSLTITTGGPDKDHPRIVENLDISGFLWVKAANVTVRNTRIRCDASDCLHAYSTGLTVSRVEIGPLSGQTNAIGIMDGNTSAARNTYDGVNLHNTGDGIRCDGGIELKNSWVHALAFGGAVHSDACQATDVNTTTATTPDPGNLVFRHNVIEGGNTSCFLIQGSPTGPVQAGSQVSVEVDDNLLLGISQSGEQTSYATNVGANVAQGTVVVSRNVFGGSFQAGVDGSSSNYHWGAATWWGNTYVDGSVVGVP